jgi:hypothetical protein
VVNAVWPSYAQNDEDWVNRRRQEIKALASIKDDDVFTEAYLAFLHSRGLGLVFRKGSRLLAGRFGFVDVSDPGNVVVKSKTKEARLNDKDFLCYVSNDGDIAVVEETEQWDSAIIVLRSGNRIGIIRLGSALAAWARVDGAGDFEKIISNADLERLILD